MSEKKKLELDVTEGQVQIHAGLGSSYGAYLHIINALLGIGTLGLAGAVNNSGWIGIILICLGGFFSIYTGTLLVECMNDTRKGFMETYPDVGDVCFGKIGRYVVQACQCSIICGGVTIYMVYAGTAVHDIIKANNIIIDLRVFICLAGLIIWIPLVTFKTIREVSFISFFGGLATIVTVIIVVVLCFIELPNLELQAAEPFIKIQGIGSILATLAFAYGGTMIYPHVYRSMENPKQWRVVVSSATLTAMSCYLIISSVGYAVFRSATESPILKNFPQGYPTRVSSLLIACHVLCAGTVFLCTLSLEAERFLNVSVENLGWVKELLFRFIIRTIIVACLVGIGCLVPFFGLLVELVGAISECMLVFIVPTLCHIRLFGWRHRPIYEKLWIILILIVATICLIFGTKGAIEGLINEFAKNHPI